MGSPGLAMLGLTMTKALENTSMRVSCCGKEIKEAPGEMSFRSQALLRSEDVLILASTDGRERPTRVWTHSKAVPDSTHPLDSSLGEN